MGCDPERSAFVGGRNESEQQLGAGVVQESESELVDEHELVAELRVEGYADGAEPSLNLEADGPPALAVGGEDGEIR